MSFEKSFQIEGRVLSESAPVFVIAEIGINHNGDERLARKMIDEAALCGVDCVKFQTFRAEEFMADREMTYEYSSQGETVSEKMFDMFKKTELSESSYAKIFDYSREKGMIPLTSVADPESADMIESVGVGAFKLASEDFINLPLLEHMAQKKAPLILSTGMANQEELEDVLTILKRHKKKNVLFFHCVSVYPTPDEEVNLQRMLELKNLAKAAVGYSDHSLGITACIGAVAMGAIALEKHFTSDRNLPGPDQSLSSDPQEMKALVDAVRRMEKMKGESQFAPSATEKTKLKEFRRSIVAVRGLDKGHSLKKEDIALRRPGTGLRARELPEILGKKLKISVQENQQILSEMLES